MYYTNQTHCAKCSIRLTTMLQYACSRSWGGKTVLLFHLHLATKWKIQRDEYFAASLHQFANFKYWWLSKSPVRHKQIFVISTKFPTYSQSIWTCFSCFFFFCCFMSFQTMSMDIMKHWSKSFAGWWGCETENLDEVIEICQRSLKLNWTFDRICLRWKMVRTRWIFGKRKKKIRVREGGRGVRKGEREIIT